MKINEKEFLEQLSAEGLNLTEQQKRAVVNDQGPLLLLATVNSTASRMTLTSRNLGGDSYADHLR